MSVRPPRHLGTVAAVASLTGTSGAEPAESATIAVVDPNKAAIAGRPAAWSDPNEPSNHLTFNRQYPRVRGDVHLTTVQVLAVRPNPERVLAAGSDSRPALAPVWEPALDPDRPLLFPANTDARPADAGTDLRRRPTASGAAPAGEVTYHRFTRRSSRRAASWPAQRPSRRRGTARRAPTRRSSRASGIRTSGPPSTG